MSAYEDREKRQRRQGNKLREQKKQVKIAKDYGFEAKEPHRYEKHSFLNCGNKNCVMCMNPRKYGKCTYQEMKLFQDIEGE